jgi:aminopeptidase N
VWDALASAYKGETDAGVAARILDAMTAFYSRPLLAQTLAWAAPSLRVDALPRLLLRLSRNPCGRDLAYAYVTANWASVIAQYGAGGFDLDDTVGAMGAGFSSTQYLQALGDFFEAAADDVGPSPSVGRVLESIGGNRAWAAANKADVCQFVGSLDYVGGEPTPLC